MTTAVTVVAFAGLATLQVLSLRAADSALERTQATTLASEMIERMRANRGDKDSGQVRPWRAYHNKTLCRPGVATCSNSEVNCSEDPPTDSVQRDLEALWCALDQAGMPNWYAAIQGPEGSRLL